MYLYILQNINYKSIFYMRINSTIFHFINILYLKHYYSIYNITYFL